MSTPIVTKTTPESGAIGVDKAASISFDLYDLENDINLPTVRVFIRGVLTYDGVTVKPGWSQSVISRLGSSGYTILLVPDREQYHRANDEITIRVVAEDLTAFELDTSWSFSATANLWLASYRFILGSVRDLDEEVG